jgi:2-dehydropantoate 2-reductase
MRFLILGAGGLGGYFGGMLVRNGAEVTFLVRPRRAAQLAKHNLVIKEPAGDLVIPVKTVTAGEVDGKYDVVFLTCKAYDLDSSVEAIAPAIGPGSAILPVLNGVNHIDILREHFGAEQVLGGMIIVRAELAPNGDIVRPTIGGVSEDAAFGELTGERSARCEAIHKTLMSAGIPSRISDDILGEMWTKFCGFCCNAAVSTLTRAFAGEIASAPAGAGFVRATFDECARATAAEGYPPPHSLRDLCVGLYSQPGLGYRPSIAADLEAGRPTEGEHTIGDLVRRADRRGLDVPILQAALCNLQIQEARRLNQPAGC